MTAKSMRKLIENVQVTEETFGMENVLEALQDLLDSTSLQAYAGHKHSAQMKAQEILDSFGVKTSMREVDPMADPDDFGVQDDITGDTSRHLPTNVFYSIKEIPGDERYGEPDEFIIWRHEGSSSSAVGNPGDAQSVEQAETLIAADAKQMGLGNRYEIEYR